jgi:hypothetical protein
MFLFIVDARGCVPALVNAIASHVPVDWLSAWAKKNLPHFHEAGFLVNQAP